MTTMLNARTTNGKTAGGNGHLEVALPEPGKVLTQDSEWCVVRYGDEWRRVRFHDYEKLFAIPGLYEKVIYDILACNSPEVITGLLATAMVRDGMAARDLHVLDLGAGNGMVGEHLSRLGTKVIVGVDIIDEAAKAAERDRPGVYHDYHVLDLTRLTDQQRQELSAYKFNCLTCVAALGFGDIPVAAFATAYNLVRPDGWIAFNIKEAFLNGQDKSGFADLVRQMTQDGILQVERRQRYQHRLGTNRNPIHYVAMVGRKRSALDESAFC